MVTIFDFFTFFLGLFLTALGEYFLLAGGADSNIALAIFAVLITLVGIGISYIRELTTDNAAIEKDLRKIYGFICFLSGIAYVIIPIWQAAIRLTSGQLSIGAAFLLLLTVVVGLVYLFIGYSWVGAFDDAGKAELVEELYEQEYADQMPPGTPGVMPGRRVGNPPTGGRGTNF